MEKASLLEALSKGVVTVVFTKKDGTDRTMSCTRNSVLIPSEFHPKNESKEIGDNIPVFDVEANGWRSFNYNSLKV